MQTSELGTAAPAEPLSFSDLFHQALRERVGPDRYRCWFDGKTRFDLVDDEVRVGVPNLMLQEILTKNFGDVIRSVAEEFHRSTVRFRIDGQLFQEARARQEAVKEIPPPAPTAVPPAPKPSRVKPGATLFDGVEEKPVAGPKRRWRRLSEFVVGACNRVAYAAALSVTEEPGQGPNPLVIHGPVGTGKTHLLEGIFGSLKRRDSSTRVLYVTAEDFTNRFINSVRFGKQNSFRKQFRSCEVLLLDDLHFLIKKRATQEEFLHTFDALLDAGNQVVLTCDCHPRLNEEFMPELLDRLLGGAIWGLLPPDPATRLDVLRQKVSAAHALIPDDVLQELADQLRGNVRELEGAVHTLKHYAQVTGRRLDRLLAREALGDLLHHAVRVVRLADVDAAVCGVLRLPPGTLQQQDRAWAVSHPRMLAVYLARKHTSASYSEISRFFSGKSHSAAVAAEKRIRAWLTAGKPLAIGGRDWPLRDIIDRVERDLLQ